MPRAQPPTAYFTTRLFRRSTLETDCWCGGMSYWTGWNGKRSIKPKTRTRRLSGLMNSFVGVPVVVFVSRKETMQRERHIPKKPCAVGITRATSVSVQTGGGRSACQPESTTKPVSRGVLPPAATPDRRPLLFCSSRPMRFAHRAGVTRCR